MNPLPFRTHVFHLLLALTLLAFPFGLQAQSPSSTELASSSSSAPLPEAPALNPPVAPPVDAASRHRVETSFSLGAFPQLAAPRLQSTSYGNFNTESNSPSAGVLATFRQSFSNWLGYSVNLGYTRTATHYTQNPGINTVASPGNFAVPANAYEASLSWLGQKPITRKLTFFYDLGAGVVTYLPVHRGANAILYAPDHYPAYVPSVNFRPLGVGGLGFEYHITPRLGFRAEYRAQLYKFPDYGFGVPHLTTVSSQPTFSLTYTLHSRKH